MILKRIFWILFCLLALLFLAGFIGYWVSSNVCANNAPAQGDLIKAVTYCEYGGPEVLKFGDVVKPTPGDDDLLVKIHAAGVNPLDWHYMRGAPYIIRLMAGMRYPQDVTMGVDFAGTVEAVGSNCKVIRCASHRCQQCRKS